MQPLAPGPGREAVAPEQLSISENPEDSLEFVERVSQLYEKRRPVFVNLSQVKQIDYDALAILLSQIVRFKEARIQFNGNFPQHPQANMRLHESGFFDVLFKKRLIVVSSNYKFQGSSAFVTHADKDVEASLTNRLLAETSREIWGEERRPFGAQRLLIELMHNTHNHASPREPGRNHWWLSVDRQPHEKRAVFAFLDLGVGIFKSLERKSWWEPWRIRFADLFGRRPTDAETLRMMLSGELKQSVTDKSFRGNGLPAIGEIARNNWVSNLRIVTNNVVAHVDSNSFQTVRTPFAGTLISWEINESNKSLKAAP